MYTDLTPIKQAITGDSTVSADLSTQASEILVGINGDNTEFQLPTGATTYYCNAVGVNCYSEDITLSSRPSVVLIPRQGTNVTDGWFIGSRSTNIGQEYALTADYVFTTYKERIYVRFVKNFPTGNEWPNGPWIPIGEAPLKTGVNYEVYIDTSSNLAGTMTLDSLSMTITLPTGFIYGAQEYNNSDKTKLCIKINDCWMELAYLQIDGTTPLPTVYASASKTGNTKTFGYYNFYTPIKRPCVKNGADLGYKFYGIAWKCGNANKLSQDAYKPRILAAFGSDVMNNINVFKVQS